MGVVLTGWTKWVWFSKMDKWVWLHVLLPLSLLRWLLRDVRPTWGDVHTAYTPTHLGHLNSTLQSVLCITQLLSSGLKFLDVQDCKY